MPAQSPQHLILELPPDVAFLPAAVAAAENAAQVYGLDQTGALKLSLAVEEFFAYLCGFAGREEPLRLTFTHGGTFVRMAFRFRAGEVSLRALNFAASVDLEGEGAQDEHDAELGLLVASRTTDRCSLESSGAGVYVLLAEVDRQYPEAEPLHSEQVLTPPVKVPSLEAAPPTDGQLRHAALLAAGHYPARSCPASFFRPARFADMVTSGQYHALLAQDATGKPAGLLCWRGSGPKSVVFSGPYVFDANPDRSLGKEIARLLTERFLGAVARTEAVCAFSERPTADIPEGWFESLGSLTLHGLTPEGDEGGEPETQAALFRHLREDVGGAVWAHPDLSAFLSRQYDRLAFSRDILTTEERPIQRAPEHSLLATSYDRRRGLALLKPLLDGQDFETNLAAHVTALQEQALSGAPPDILLHLDLSEPWQAALYPAITACGFAPRLILPHAGASDLLVCQHVPANS